MTRSHSTISSRTSRRISVLTCRMLRWRSLASSTQKRYWISHSLVLAMASSSYRFRLSTLFSAVAPISIPCSAMRTASWQRSYSWCRWLYISFAFFNWITAFWRRFLSLFHLSRRLLRILSCLARCCFKGSMNLQSAKRLQVCWVLLQTSRSWKKSKLIYIH